MGRLALALVFFLSVQTFADTVMSEHHHGKGSNKVLEACTQAILKPVPPSGKSVNIPAKESTPADRTAIQACVIQFHENIKACFQNAGIPMPQPGQKPSDSDLAASKKCGAEAFSKISAPNG